MAFINAQLDDTKEPEAAPEGEYDLRIVRAERKESKKGKMMTEVLIRIEDADVNAPPLRQYLIDVTPDMPEDQQRMRKLELKRFLQCFGIKLVDGGYDEEDLAGATGRCMVIQEENGEYGLQNRLRLPRLRE